MKLKIKNLGVSVVVAALLLTCGSKRVFDHGIFEIGTSIGVLDNGEIDEASGLAYSMANPPLLWTHNDSGDKARLFLINDNGQHKATFYLKGMTNRDWEDIAVGPGPDKNKSYVYVGEIGDNLGIFKYKYVYRFPEPVVSSANTVTIDTIYQIDSIKFQLSDRPRDAEALVVDPLTRDIYIFSKREEKHVNLYALPYPQSTKSLNTARLLRQIPFTQIVAADISPDGQELLVKNYKNVYYWRREGEESITQLFDKTPARLPYAEEPQGEAIAFDFGGNGYYTLSEAPYHKRPHLMFYKRKQLKDNRAVKD